MPFMFVSSKINVDCMNIGLHNDVFAFKECGIRIVYLNINHFSKIGSSQTYFRLLLYYGYISFY